MERIELISKYHRRARIRLPNVKVHAVMHAVVENQIALGDELPVKKKLAQLMREGLDRHDAIHAIAWILSREMYWALKEPHKSPDMTKSYFAGLEDLTAENWLRSGKE